MRLTALPVEPLEDLDRLVVAGLAAPRSPGVHCADLIRSLMRRLDKKYDEEVSEDGPSYWQMGYAWERIVGLTMGERAAVSQGWVRAPEIQCDGVWLTPDWLTATSWAETKATYKSCRELDDTDGWLMSLKWLPWLYQLSAYAHALGCYDPELYVYFVQGDYSEGPKPLRRRWRVELDPSECADRWQQLLRHGKKDGLL